MEIKHWHEYTLEDKKKILYFWWNSMFIEFYIDTSRENEQFDQIVDMDIDLVFSTAVMLYCNKCDSRVLFEVMMEGNLCRILNKTLEYRASHSSFGRFEEMSDIFIRRFVKQYNETFKGEFDGTEQEKKHI